jgi:tRNA-2-methylthio-N6-dimethylallyladenosine synthase
MPYLSAGESGTCILKAMEPAHTRQSYLRCSARVWQRVLMAISGFHRRLPGETEADFEETPRIVHEVAYAQAYSFKYSQRPGMAATMA